MGQREKDRESEAGSMLSSEPDLRLHLTTLKSRPQHKSKVRLIEPPRYPGMKLFVLNYLLV